MSNEEPETGNLDTRLDTVRELYSHELNAAHQIAKRNSRLARISLLLLGGVLTLLTYQNNLAEVADLYRNPIVIIDAWIFSTYSNTVLIAIIVCYTLSLIGQLTKSNVSPHVHADILVNNPDLRSRSDHEIVVSQIEAFEEAITDLSQRVSDSQLHEAAILNLLVASVSFTIVLGFTAATDQSVNIFVLLAIELLFFLSLRYAEDGWYGVVHPTEPLSWGILSGLEED